MKRAALCFCAVTAAVGVLLSGCLREDNNSSWWELDKHLSEQEPASSVYEPAVSAWAREAAAPRMGQPVLITSLGQSADAVMLQAVFDRLNIATKMVPSLSEVEPDSYASAVIVVGSSGKGLAAAGITPEEELARAAQLVAALQEQGKPVLVAHTGGAARRDQLTLQLMEVAVPAADVLLVLSGGDPDGEFADYAQQQGLLFSTADSVVDTAPFIKLLFVPEA